MLHNHEWSLYAHLEDNHLEWRAVIVLHEIEQQALILLLTLALSQERHARGRHNRHIRRDARQRMGHCVNELDATFVEHGERFADDAHLTSFHCSPNRMRSICAAL